MGARWAVGVVGRLRDRLTTADVWAVNILLALALLVTSGLWLHGGSATTAENTLDHAQFLFFFQHAADAVTHLHNPLFTPLLGAPYGVNLMANTAFLGLAVPLIPVTLLAGPAVSYALALTICLAGTAVAWYVVLLRHVTTHRGAAFAGAALAGFAPGIVGHGNGHPNLTAQFLLPLIISAVVRMGHARSIWRSGLWLGVLVAWQIFLNEELLLFTVLASVVLVVVYALSRPHEALAQARRFAAGLGVALGLAAVLTAYPLWFQFAGPQHYTGPFTWAPLYTGDLAAYPAYGANSLAGRIGSVSALDTYPPETNAFLGLPLCLFALGAAVALWRMLAARVAAVVAAIFLLLSLGSSIRYRGVDTHVPGPLRLLAALPLFDSVIASRFALVVTPAVAVLVAAAADRLLAGVEPGPQAWSRRVLIWSALGALLLPLVPSPLKTTEPDPVPPFITAGTWQRYVGTGTIVPVPPDAYSEATLRWLVAADLRPRFVDGYFLGPTSPDYPVARYGAPERPTGLLLADAASSGVEPEITDGTRALAVADLRFWQADVLVLAPKANDDVLRQTVDDLLNRPAQYVDGVWVWDVRDLVAR